MSAYLVGTVRILNEETFAAYGAAIRGLSARFGGEPVLAGRVTEVLEGASPVGERVVVTRFETAAQARAYIDSDPYQAAHAMRQGAAELELRIVEI